MKRVLAVCDENHDYVSRFVRFIENREGGMFTCLGFTDGEAFREALARQRFDLVLAGEAFPLPESAGGFRTCLLCGEKGRDGIYRYQSVEQVLREAAALLEEDMEEGPSAGEIRTRIYGVYSPVKRCYKTTLALTLGEILAEKEATLYLSLEDMPHYPAFIEEGEENLSDLLYRFRADPNSGIRLSRAVRKLGRLAYIPPVSCPEDIRGAPSGDMLSLLQRIGSLDAYKNLVLDIGDAIPDPFPVLRLCRRIYMPIREDAVSMTRIEEFGDWAKSRGESDLLRRTQKIRVPKFPEMEKQIPDYSNLRQSPLGRYVECKMEEHVWK